jgi:hypothetical protein
MEWLVNNTDSSETAIGGRKLRQAEASTALPDALIEASRSRSKFMAAVVLGAVLAAGPMCPPITNFYARRPRESSADSSTSAVFADPALLLTVKDLFEKGAQEFFHDGMESQFSLALISMLSVHGADFLSAISEYLFSGEGKPEVVSEALRWLADYGTPETLTKRWSILRHSLKSPSHVVRDGAILGFAALDDPRARNLLLEARNIEEIKELQLLIEHVAARLSRRQ